MTGAQSILVKNLENYQIEFDDKLLKLGDKYTLSKRFMIGESVNFNEMMHVKMFHNILCTDNCELVEYIDKKIKGKLRECGVKYNKKPTVSELFKMYQKQVENCSITEITDSCCDWSEIAW